MKRSFCSVVMMVAASGSFLLMPALGQQTNPQPVQPTAAQQPGTFTLQVNTQIVVLDVVVNNKNGDAVRNLTKDDFTVYENKVPQTIRSFESTAQPGTTSAPAAPIAVNSTAELDHKEPQAPVSIIVLDELATKFEDEAFARYSLKKYLGTQGDTLAQPTMLVSVSLRNLTVLRDYTTSKKEILDALDHHFTVYPWQMMNGNWKGEQLSAAFSSLMEVAEATGGHPGHKNIVWVGRGFPMVDITMMDPTSADQMQALIAQCTNMLRDARVTLYSIDPAGLAAEQPGQDENGFDLDSPFGGQVDFETMARATGGQAFHGRNDVDMQIGTSVRDGETFYTLTYKPTTVSQDPKEFRRIQVIMKDRSLRAVTREGYFAASPPPAPALNPKGQPSDQLVFDLGIAGASMMVYDGVPLEITRDPKQADQSHREPARLRPRLAGNAGRQAHFTGRL